MTEEKIQEFLTQLKNKKYKSKDYTGGYSDSSVIYSEAFSVFEPMLRNFLLDNRDEQLAILEAKVFMYEEIISKSTFAPLVSKTKSIKKVKETDGK